MTGRELFSQVRALAAKAQWTYPFESAAAFCAVNRALLEVSRLFPTYKTLRLAHCPASPLLFIGGCGKESDVFACDGACAVAFEAAGTGSAALFSDGELIESFEWHDLTSFEKMSFISARPSRLSLKTVSGAHLVRRISFYSDGSFDRAEDVYAYGDELCYCMSDSRYAGERFAAFAPCPVSLGSRLLKSPEEYRLDGDALYLPTARAGEYLVRYACLPDELCEDNVDAELDIDARVHDLVSLRAAYYLYLLTDSDVADRCGAEYQRLLPTVLARLRSRSQLSGLRDIRGW